MEAQPFPLFAKVLQVGEGVEGWAKKVKGLNKMKEKRLVLRQQYGDYQREKEVEKGKWGVHSDGRSLDLGWWRHDMVYR